MSIDLHVNSVFLCSHLFSFTAQPASLHQFFLQDGPFFTLRILLLVKYDVRSYMHIFFTVKNTLVLLLMFYRLFVLFESKRAQHLEAKKAAAVAVLRDDYIDLDEVIYKLNLIFRQEIQTKLWENFV